jgi:hypothetical protein
MGIFLCYGPYRVTPVVVLLDQAEVETNSEPAQGESEDIHLGVGGAGDEKKADETEHGHHQSNDEVTHVAFHLHLSWAATAKLRREREINIDSHQCGAA